MALDILDVKYNHIFSSEIDKNCINFIEKNFNPNRIYHDLKERNNKQYKKSLDLYIAGFPCQTFSSLGNKEGFLNKTKGTIFFDIYDFISVNRPNIFILENVRSLLTHDKGNTFHIINELLQELNEYNIYHNVLNTYDYGIPQSRNRIFIVGIKKKIQTKPFTFPKPINMMDLSKFINLKNINKGKNFLPEAKQQIFKNIKNKYNDIDFNKDLWILNLNVSGLDWFRLGYKNICPCLITSCKYYIPRLNRYIDPFETLLLQGIPIQKYDFNSYTDNILYKFAGNTISVNVISMILCNLFKVVNL